MTRDDNPTPARTRVALEKGRALVRRIDHLDTMTAGEVAALADDFAALLAEHPDVFPEPPVRLEVLRARVAELRAAEERVRKEHNGVKPS